jgi:hypothetical protein
MIYWLNTHYVLVFLIAFVGILMMVGGWMIPFIWDDIFEKSNIRRKSLLRMVEVQIVIAIIGALAFCYFVCFTYTEDQIYKSQAETTQGEQ